ncbi:unnamed protein product, partial [Ectocarpus sp. 12 AP-2014]
ACLTESVSISLSVCLSLCSFLFLSVSLCVSTPSDLPSYEYASTLQHRWQARNMPPPIFMPSRQFRRLYYKHRFKAGTTCSGGVSVGYLPATISCASLRQTSCFTSRNALCPFTR